MPLIGEYSVIVEHGLADLIPYVLFFGLSFFWVKHEKDLLLS